MDLSSLTRPAILCQCARCSSSLAVLENEWAKLSNSYSIAAGWLSVDLNRILVSSDRKQVPQASDLSLLRGRILQEVSCKLCQQKLAVLCALDNGPNIFWKLGKVSFREVVTMKTVEPVFKDGVLERLICSPPKQPNHFTSTYNFASARKDMVPAGSPETGRHTSSVEQQIQHQGTSIDHISSSVCNLHDTMAELKSAFTALRIELNGCGIEGAGNNFDMISTVLKELKSKSEEIERLKLEIEALKLRSRCIEERSETPGMRSASSMAFAEAQSPGCLLSSSRKRPWTGSFPYGRTQPIADSFDGDDEDPPDDFALTDAPPPHTVKVPLREPGLITPLTEGATDVQSQAELPNPDIESQRSHSALHYHDTADSQPESMQHVSVKRQRVGQQVDSISDSKANERRKPGRPRKSFSQTPRPDSLYTPQPPSQSEQRDSRKSRKRSRPPSASRASHLKEPENDYSPIGTPETQTAENTEPDFSDGPELEKTYPSYPSGNGKDYSRESIKMRESRESQVASRDKLARLAMQREEAMETEGAQ